jgi:thiamine biosynthesis lipoprotein
MQFIFQAIGTKWVIDIYKSLSEIEKEKEANLFDLIKKRIDLFDIAYSRFRDDSLVAEISRKAGDYVLPEDAKPMMDLYFDLYKKTDGLVTPLIGNLISDAGYDAKYSLKQKKELEKAPAWEDVIEYNHPNLKVKKPVLLDFGAAGKGYLVDLVSNLIEENGYDEYCVDAGGDIFYKNKEVLKVGLENPDNTKQVIGVCELKDESICGSAGNRRAWGNFTHIINPKTMTSPKEIKAVWVVAKTALLADALTTCLFFVEPETLTETYDFEYVILYANNTLRNSEGWKGEIFVG